LGQPLGKQKSTSAYDFLPAIEKWICKRPWNVL